MFLMWPKSNMRVVQFVKSSSCVCRDEGELCCRCYRSRLCKDGTVWFDVFAEGTSVLVCTTVGLKCLLGEEHPAAKHVTQLNKRDLG